MTWLQRRFRTGLNDILTEIENTRSILYSFVIGQTLNSFPFFVCFIVKFCDSFFLSVCLDYCQCQWSAHYEISNLGSHILFDLFCQLANVNIDMSTSIQRSSCCLGRCRTGSFADKTQAGIVHKASHKKDITKTIYFCDPFSSFDKLLFNNA